MSRTGCFPWWFQGSQTAVPKFSFQAFLWCWAFFLNFTWPVLACSGLIIYAAMVYRLHFLYLELMWTLLKKKLQVIKIILNSTCEFKKSKKIVPAASELFIKFFYEKNNNYIQANFLESAVYKLLLCCFISRWIVRLFLYWFTHCKISKFVECFKKHFFKQDNHTFFK